MPSRAMLAAGLLVLVSGIGLSDAALANSPPADPAHPNIVLILTDQHRMASFPGEAHTGVRAPNLSRLAAEGVTFSHAISNYPVCSPFRAMLMSGLAPYKTGVIDNMITLRDKGASMGHLFAQAGYATGYIGKWHLGGSYKPRPKMHGFEFFEAWRSTTKHHASTYWDPRRGHVDYEGYNVTGMTDHAMTFIKRHLEGPFLLVLSINSPHANFFDAPPAFQALYAEKEVEVRPNVKALVPGHASTNPTRSVERIRRGYLANISALDHDLGRLLNTLDSLGVGRDTIVVYTSDHGEMLGSQGLLGKRAPYEESIRIPLVIRWPGHIAPGTREEDLVGAIDLLPTLLGLAGIDIPQSLDGRDRSARLRGKGGEATRYQPIMHVSSERTVAKKSNPSPLFRGVRTKRFTYAATERGAWLLFNNELDPFQMHNLVDEPTSAEDLARLQGMTREWLVEYDDPFVLPDLE